MFSTARSLTRHSSHIQLNFKIALGGSAAVELAEAYRMDVVLAWCDAGLNDSTADILLTAGFDYDSSVDDDKDCWRGLETTDVLITTVKWLATRMRIAARSTAMCLMLGEV